MNERIKELWDQAAKLEPDPSWEGQTKFMEKFTELVVEECAEVLSKVPGGTDSTLYYNHNRVLKKHFGVEK